MALVVFVLYFLYGNFCIFSRICDIHAFILTSKETPSFPKNNLAFLEEIHVTPHTHNKSCWPEREIRTYASLPLFHLLSWDVLGRRNRLHEPCFSILLLFYISLQKSTLFCAPGSGKFFSAEARLFCLALPGSFLNVLCAE